MTILIRPVDREIQAFLQSIGAPTLNIKRYAVMGDLGNIVAASETLAAVPSEFLPHNVFCTGPWSITGGEEHPNQELIAFLNRHPHPIVVSLGSMGGTDGQALTERIVRAIRTIGLPAVIQNGYAGLNSAEKDELLHFTGFVSHEYLFPRAKLVVHHGGAGTTAAVCKAGVPSVVIAFIADQPYFGKALQNIGLAPKLIWHYKLSSQNLAGRIRLALKPQMQEKAKQLKSKFENEKGVDAAADWIEQRFLHNRPEKP